MRTPSDQYDVAPDGEREEEMTLIARSGTILHVPPFSGPSAALLLD